MILVFGATGFSGRMTVERLVERGLPVRAAARSQEKLELLAERFAGIETAVADVADPDSVARAAAGCDLLITTVGPYTTMGHIAADAALSAGLPYIDITGEPAWLRRVFDEYDERFAAAGLPLLPAIGYDYVPGNLAGALALERAGEAARSVDVGYFLTGRNPRTTESFSKGTLESLEASSEAVGFAFAGGAIVDTTRPRKVLEFELDGEPVTAVAIGGTEHFGLPRFASQLTDVNVGLGWFQPGGESAPDDPGHEGPAEDQRAAARTNVIAIARDADGEELSRVRVGGPNPYDLSGLATAWAAERLLEGAVNGAGALTPVEAFGLAALRDGCAEFGLSEI